MKRRTWTRGSSVAIRLDDGATIKGTVWAESDVEGEVWVALDDHRYARVRTSTGLAQVCDAQGRGQAMTGHVAA